MILKIILYLIFIVFPFGQILRFRLPFLPLTVKFQPIDILVCVYWISWLMSNPKKVTMPKFFKEILLFCIIAGISFLIKFSLYNTGEVLSAFFYLLRLWNYCLFYLALSNLKEKINLKRMLIFSGLLSVVFCLLQYFFIPDLRFLKFSGWDDHYFRAVGTFLDPGFTGLVLVLTLILILTDSPFFKQKLAYFFSILILLLGIALSFSRVSYLTVFLAISIIFFSKRKAKLFFIFSALLVLFIIISPKPGGEGINLLRKFSILLKVENYQQSKEIIKDNFIFGTGYNFYRIAQRNYGFVPADQWENSNAAAGADNSFLFIFATTGITGLLVFLNFWAKTIVTSFNNRKKEADLIIFVSFVVISVQSFFINAVFYPWILFWITVLLSAFRGESEA